MAELLYYQTADARQPFDRWYEELDTAAALKVNTALTRLAAGNTSNVKPVGEGVSELKIDFGPGYRVYFGQRGGDPERLDKVILLVGGTKRTQAADIKRAKAYWSDYRTRTRRA